MHRIRASLLVCLISCIAALAGFGDVAFGQRACGVTIIKDAPGGSGTIFEYEVTVDDDPPFLVELPGGESSGGSFSSRVAVTELPIAGWALTDISCENTGATGFEIIENGFTAGCDGGGTVTCTFFNVSTQNIPTLSEWGLIAAAAGLGLIGMFFALKRSLSHG